MLLFRCSVFQRSSACSVSISCRRCVNCHRSSDPTRRAPGTSLHFFSPNVVVRRLALVVLACRAECRLAQARVGVSPSEAPPFCEGKTILLLCVLTILSTSSSESCWADPLLGERADRGIETVGLIADTSSSNLTLTRELNYKNVFLNFTDSQNRTHSKGNTFFITFRFALGKNSTILVSFELLFVLDAIWMLLSSNFQRHILHTKFDTGMNATIRTKMSTTSIINTLRLSFKLWKSKLDIRVPVLAQSDIIFDIAVWSKTACLVFLIIHLLIIPQTAVYCSYWWNYLRLPQFEQPGHLSND